MYMDHPADADLVSDYFSLFAHVKEGTLPVDKIKSAILFQAVKMGHFLNMISFTV